MNVIWNHFSHAIWLRDHCSCSECYHAETHQRLLDPLKVKQAEALNFILLKVFIYHDVILYFTFN
jgi:hypothetical protein